MAGHNITSDTIELHANISQDSMFNLSHESNLSSTKDIDLSKEFPMFSEETKETKETKDKNENQTKGEKPKPPSKRKPTSYVDERGTLRPNIDGPQLTPSERLQKQRRSSHDSEGGRQRSDNRSRRSGRKSPESRDGRRKSPSGQDPRRSPYHRNERQQEEKSRFTRHNNDRRGRRGFSRWDTTNTAPRRPESNFSDGRGRGKPAPWAGRGKPAPWASPPLTQESQNTFRDRGNLSYAMNPFNHETFTPAYSTPGTPASDRNNRRASRWDQLPSTSTAPPVNDPTNGNNGPQATVTTQTTHHGTYIDAEERLRPLLPESHSSNIRSRLGLRSKPPMPANDMPASVTIIRSKEPETTLPPHRIRALMENKEAPKTYAEAAAVLELYKRYCSPETPVTQTRVRPPSGDAYLQEPNWQLQEAQQVEKRRRLWNTPKPSTFQHQSEVIVLGSPSPTRVSPPNEILIGSKLVDTTKSSSGEEGQLISPRKMTAKPSQLHMSTIDVPDGTLMDDDVEMEVEASESPEKAFEGGSNKEAASQLNSSFVDRLQEEQAQETPMDWEAGTPALLVIEKCRQAVRRSSSQPEVTLPVAQNKPSNPLNASEPRQWPLYIVVDTNIFLSQMGLLRALIADECERDQVLLYVPWTVLQELDVLKVRGDEKLRRDARRAIQFLSEESTNAASKLVGQTMAEADACKKYTAAGNDDLILQSAFYLRSQAYTVLLYTNDKLLGVKAKTCDIMSTDSARLKRELANAFKTRQEEKLAWEARRQTLQTGPMGTEKTNDMTEVSDALSEVWGFLYSYTTFFMKRCGVESSAFDNPAPVDLPDVTMRDRRFRKFLNELRHIITQLEERMERVVKIQPATLTVLDTPLHAFTDSLRVLPLHLKAFAFEEHAALLPTPELKPIRLESLLEVMVNFESREKFKTGHVQLRQMNSVLRKCNKKMTAPIKF